MGGRATIRPLPDEGDEALLRLKPKPNSDLLTPYVAVRSFTERLCETLSPEDCQVQSMPDVSPTRWHLAHTTWFFETFVLRNASGYRLFDERYPALFNSYYNSLGSQFPRPRRGLVTRPGLGEVLEYRAHVDRHMRARIESGDLSAADRAALTLGLNHEQQHQELIVTDIKHVLSLNPLAPAFREDPLATVDAKPAGAGRSIAEGVHEIGHEGPGFHFDNEGPRHRVYLQDCTLDDALVTAGDYLAFMEDGAYADPLIWLSLGWQALQEQGWEAPLYWYERDGVWWQHTLAGPAPVDPDAPVTHVSYFEADAFARWAGARLPTEAEWEVAAGADVEEGGFADQRVAAGRAIHPSGHGRYGEVWQWTSSAYAAYPGYAPAPGALGEYNGKFMCNQYVLRGGSCATPSDHTRPTYRNFFPPEARWQFSGIRLAR